MNCLAYLGINKNPVKIDSSDVKGLWFFYFFGKLINLPEKIKFFLNLINLKLSCSWKSIFSSGNPQYEYGIEEIKSHPQYAEVMIKYLKGQWAYFKQPSMQRWQCRIQNCTLCLIKYKLDINVYIFLTDYLELWFLYKSDLRKSM